MKTHSQTQRRASHAAAPREVGFLGAWNRLLDGVSLPTVGRRRGRKPKVLLGDLLALCSAFSGPVSRGSTSFSRNRLFVTAQGYARARAFLMTVWMS
jgi:hypothetical protein